MNDVVDQLKPIEPVNMTRNQIISQAQKTFKKSRPLDMFIRGTCSCDECMEHEAVMQTFNSINLPLDQLNNQGWDPICFASNDAFMYLMPGLVKLALDHTEDYIQQFIFHVEQPDRLAALTPEQSQMLTFVLDFLVLHKAKELDDNFVVDDLLRTKEQLERITGGDGKISRPSA